MCGLLCVNTLCQPKNTYKDLIAIIITPLQASLAVSHHLPFFYKSFSLPKKSGFLGVIVSFCKFWVLLKENMKVQPFFAS